MIVPSYVESRLANPRYYFESEESKKELAPEFGAWRRDTERLFNLKEARPRDLQRGAARRKNHEPSAVGACGAHDCRGGSRRRRVRRFFLHRS